MKRNLTIAAAVLCAAVSCSPIPSQCYKKYDLAGPARSMEVTAYKGEFSYNVLFGGRGVVSRVDYFNEDGSIRFSENFSYDRRNRMVENLVVGADGVSEGKYTYEYDGRFVSVSKAFGMNSDEVYKWENRNDGKNIVESVFFIEGSPDSITYSDYEGFTCRQRTISAADSSEIGSGVMTLFREGKVSSIESTSMSFRIDYDDNGLPIHTWNTCVDSTGDIFYEPSLETNPDRYYRYEFDRRGNWIERTEHFHPDSAAIGAVLRVIQY